MIKRILPVLIVLVLLVFAILFISSHITIIDDNEGIEPTQTNTEKNENQLNSELDVFLIDKKTKEIITEKRKLSLKDLNTDPYYSIINELKKANNSTISPIPQNAKILSVELKKNTLYINFSKEFANQDFSDGLDNTIASCISKTFMNLKEVQNVVILVENDSNWF